MRTAQRATRLRDHLAALGVLSALFAGGDALRAQDPQGLERVDFRVMSAAPGSPIVIDRGAADGLQAGDSVFLRPRGVGAYKGRIVSLEERTSVIEMEQRGFTPVTGTSGNAMVPKSRFGEAPPPDPQPDPQQDPQPGAPTDPQQDPQQDPTRRWERNDKWKPGMPLLSQMRPVRPSERGIQVHGRIYSTGELAYDDSQDFRNSFFRGGTEVTMENPFGSGGAMHFDGELDLRTERNEDREASLLLKRASYRSGGHRYEPHRWEYGRFLQNGMPEFGILDGVEWGLRNSHGHRLGVSLGFMPELDEDLNSFDDLQIAGYYHWYADSSERSMISGGYQKSFHHGKTDRDLFIIKGRHLPQEDGWAYHGSAWIDLYSGRDDLKDNGIEFTQLFGSMSRDWGTSGMDFTYQRVRFPETLRDELLPVLAADITEIRSDRLTWSGWMATGEESRFHYAFFGWDDQDDQGGGTELGFDISELFGENSRTDVTLLANQAKFSNVLGGRITHHAYLEDGSFDLQYEFGNHHFNRFEDNLDDLQQHRLRVSRNYQSDDGWSVSFYAQIHQWDEELAYAAGFYVQRRFFLRDTF